ncbi:universal stress protein [Kitasatospora paracochleata]|uniref:Nucleotide-binding universal stress UspA family protein n=1 Tax=Kitasatospora paracochleata TaxID=58354 RepID=A0ABT1J2L8_9ACTN|nr:universal stress protein [Kitasatospora paracochleata]MCP2311399.1 nucleotide-binding universal stress UspA family protein [Kitasatospora paracochleata]
MATAAERRSVVLGVDSQDVHPMVIGWAAAEADRRGLPLRLVHAVPDELRDLRGFDGGRYHQALRTRGDTALEKVLGIVHERRPGLEATAVLVDGSRVHTLCRESAEAELVVLGSRGLGRLEEFLSGYSVVVPVSAQAHCPVVVVRAPEHTTQEPPYVVVGVDGSRSCEYAARFAADLAARRGAALRAVWAWQVPPVVPFDEHLAADEIRRQMHETTAGCRTDHPDLDLTHEVLTGHPVEELARVSAHALAVVVGRRGHGGFTGMRLGSVPHGLLHRAPCPVVIVPAPDHP